MFIFILSVCWHAHRGYSFCSRRSAADVLRPTIHNRRQSGTTLRPETCPKYMKTTRNQEKQFRKKTGFSRQHTRPGIVNSQFCTCRISRMTKATTFKLCSTKDHYTTTPQKKFHGSSSFRSPVIKYSILCKKTRKSQKNEGTRPPVTVFDVFLAAPGQDTEFLASLSERFCGGMCHKLSKKICRRR